MLLYCLRSITVLLSCNASVFKCALLPLSLQLQDGSELFNFLSTNIRNPLKLNLARGEPNYTNYTADFKSVIDYILCDEESTVSR